MNNIVIPHWKKKHPHGIALLVDLMGVKTNNDISERFTHSFNIAYGERFKFESFLKEAVKFLGHLKPTYELGADGKMAFSVKGPEGRTVVNYESILDTMKKLAVAGTPCFICCDEFQDVSFVAGAEAILRRKFEELPTKFPLVVLGSKQHVLSNVFEKQQAPFYKWGVRIHIEDIPYEEYYPYLRERFVGRLKETSDEVLHYLQDALFRSPEEIHRICHEANKRRNNAPLGTDTIDELISQYIVGNSTNFEMRLDPLTPAQIGFLKQIAFNINGMVSNAYSKETLSQVGVTGSGMQKIVRTLLDKGIIEKSADSFHMLDPFLFHYIRKSRLPNG